MTSTIGANPLLNVFTFGALPPPHLLYPAPVIVGCAAEPSWLLEERKHRGREMACGCEVLSSKVVLVLCARPFAWFTAIVRFALCLKLPRQLLGVP